MINTSPKITADLRFKYTLKMAWTLGSSIYKCSPFSFSSPPPPLWIKERIPGQLKNNGKCLHC